MAVKTITIDLEAYEILSRHKRPGQSFSQVIKEEFAKRKTAGDLLLSIRHLTLSDGTLDSIEEQIKKRKASPARAARL